MRRAFVLVVVTALVGCGGSEKPKTKPLPVVTIWSSMPYRGPQREQTLREERAIRGAFLNVRPLLKGFNVRYRPLDDSSVAAGGWDPGVVAVNARKAALDPTTVAFIGEPDSGATAVALPILNESGVLQLTGSSTAEGLTHGGTGAGPGAPFQYYPSGHRTLVRLTGRDSAQGAILAKTAKTDGCKSLAIFDDATIYGAGLAEIVASQARARQLPVSARSTVIAKDPNLRSAIAAGRGSCLLYAGEASDLAVQVIALAAKDQPHSRIYGPDALAASAMYSRKGLAESVQRRLSLIVPLGAESSYPSHGRWLIRNLASRSGSLVAWGVPSTYAAAELALGCLRKVAADGIVPPSRYGVVSCAMGHSHGSAALGPYRVERSGDTTATKFGRYSVTRGRIRFVRGIKPPPAIAVGNAAATASGG